MAQQAGVQIMSPLVLRGWRDRGSCFELRTATPASPDLLSLLEAEVLLLAPAFWHSSCLALFGLQLQGLQSREMVDCQVAAGSDAAGLPVVQSWGAAAPAAAGQAAAASGDQQYGPGSCSSSYQLSPMLAKSAADLIRTAGGPAADGSDAAVVGGLAVARGCLESDVNVGAMDAWAGLAELQQPRLVSASDLEQAEDEAADNRQDVLNAQL
eukprot:gene6132-6371_t